MTILRLCVLGFAVTVFAGCAVNEPPAPGPAPAGLTDPDQAAPVTGSGVFDVNE